MERVNKKKIIIVATQSDFTNILYHALSSDYSITHVIIEDKDSILNIVKQKFRKRGLAYIVGLFFFKIIIYNYLSLISRKRVNDIINRYHMLVKTIPHNNLIHVNSINSFKTIKIINDILPDLVIVNGTRIISEEVLNSVKTTFINLHAGITPLYRGVHGAYWALVNNDIANCGVTIHLVDKGIDTGGVLAQAIISPDNKKDNFYTYPYLQYGEGIKLLKEVINSYFNQTLIVKKNTDTKSFLWTHPTATQYLYNFFRRKIK